MSERRGAPSTVPALAAAVLLLVVWAADSAGYPVGTWTPGAIGAVVLLGLAVGLVPNAWDAVPVAVRVAVGGLAALTACSYASTSWADDPGTALEGANRTLLYLATFALFALWPMRPRVAGALVAVWALGVGAIAAWFAARMWLDPAEAASLLVDGRLTAPAGYPNASAGLFAMALWPALALAVAPRAPWPLRVLCGASAVVCADVALLALSRGATLATPVVALLALALVPARLRLLGGLLVVGGAAALAAPAALRVGDVLGADGVRAAAGEAALQAAGRGALLAAVGAGVVLGLAGSVGARVALRPATARRASRGLGAVALGLGVLAVAGGLVAVGDPGERLSSAWASFRGGYDQNDYQSNRLVGGLGSNRYDFYRVGVDAFRDRPVLGHGADAFAQQYLRAGRSDETPRYAHSLELRTLVGLGAVGGLLLLVALGGAAVAALAAMRAGPAQALVAGGAALVGLQWAVHGSADWFWEIAGLGAPAWALLGLACALAPRRTAAGAAAVATPGRVGRATAGVLTGLGVVVLAGPWLSARDVRAAGQEFATDPGRAYARLERAAWLDPLSDAPAAVEGSIAVRLGDLPRAAAAFSRALERVPDDQYATLRLGAIASARGDAATARLLLGRAVALAPRDPVAREALGIVRDDGTIDLAALDRRTLAGARQIGG